MTATNPANGPFMSAADLTSYSDEDGYAIRLPDATSATCSPRVLARLGLTASGKAA